MARELEVVPWESGENPEQYPLLYISSPHPGVSNTDKTVRFGRNREQQYHWHAMPRRCSRLTRRIIRTPARVAPRQVRRPAIALLYQSSLRENGLRVFRPRDSAIRRMPCLPPADVDATNIASAAGVLISIPHTPVPAAAIQLRTWHTISLISYIPALSDTPYRGMSASSSRSSCWP